MVSAIGPGQVQDSGSPGEDPAPLDWNRWSERRSLRDQLE